MDIIISASEEIIRIIKEVPLNEDGHIDLDAFMMTMESISDGKEKDELQEISI